MREKYVKLIQSLSKKGISDSTIVRITGASLSVIRNIMFKPGYKPTERMRAKIIENIDDFQKTFIL